MPTIKSSNAEVVVTRQQKVGDNPRVPLAWTMTKLDGSDRPDPRVTIIDMFPDGGLLEILFHFCVDEEPDLLHLDEWLTLVLKVERPRQAKFNLFVTFFVLIFLHFARLEHH